MLKLIGSLQMKKLGVSLKDSIGQC